MPAMCVGLGVLTSFTWHLILYFTIKISYNGQVYLLLKIYFFIPEYLTKFLMGQTPNSLIHSNSDKFGKAVIFQAMYMFNAFYPDKFKWEGMGVTPAFTSYLSVLWFTASNPWKGAIIGIE